MTAAFPIASVTAWYSPTFLNRALATLPSCRRRPPCRNPIPPAAPPSEPPDHNRLDKSSLKGVTMAVTVTELSRQPTPKSFCLALNSSCSARTAQHLILDQAGNAGMSAA